MTRAPLPLCGVCNGVHRNPPECLGRPQTDREWMIDRGVSEERCDVIETTRARHLAGGGTLGPMQPTQPTGVPLAPAISYECSSCGAIWDEPGQCGCQTGTYPPTQPIQEALF